MKKIIALILCFAMCFSLAACGKGNDKEDSEANVKEYKYEIAMLCAEDSKSIDDGAIVQTTWEGVRAFAEENGKSYKYYEAAEASEEAILEQIGLAKEAGCKVIVCAGDGFGKLLDTVTEETPDITFITIDAGKVATKNCASYVFNQLQAGFLAGYAAICSGYKDVGFIADSETEETRKYGYGFLQGAAAAGRQFGGYRDVRYTYGNGKESQKIKAWLDNGMDVIFPCGETSFTTAKAMAKDYDALVIADNEADYSGKVLAACAYCEYNKVINDALTAFFNDSLKTGKCKTMGVKADAVGLKWKTDKFVGFTQEDYDYTFNRLSENGYDIAKESEYSSVKKLVEGMNLYAVQISYEK